MAKPHTALHGAEATALPRRSGRPASSPGGASDRSGAATDLDGDIETPAALRFQARASRLERVGWAVIAAALLAAALGLVGGGGLLAERHSVARDGLRVEYDSPIHVHAPTTLRLTVTPREGDVRVALGTAWVERVALERVVPEPAAVIGGPEWTTFEFRASSAKEPMPVLFTVKPEGVGTLRARVRLDGGATLELTQLVYP